MKLLLAALGILLTFSVACGGSDDDSDEGESDPNTGAIESVMRSFMEAYSDADAEGMYDLIDSASQKACPFETFASSAIGGQSASDIPDLGVVEVTNVVVDGDHATGDVLGSVDGKVDPQPSRNSFVREDGNWKYQLPAAACS